MAPMVIEMRIAGSTNSYFASSIMQFFYNGGTFNELAAKHAMRRLADLFRYGERHASILGGIGAIGGFAWFPPVFAKTKTGF